MTAHQFGGQWTERKLDALREYLRQYQIIFTKNEAARKLRTIYVDAFAGTGERESRGSDSGESLFGYAEEAQPFQAGSARIALSLEKKFHRYVFIDSKAIHVAALHRLVQGEFSDIADRCEIVQEDANTWLRVWCASQNWSQQRAVVFLDPYGMSVEWRTIEAIAQTRAIDLWILFPFAIGVGRMMPKDMLPSSKWADVITRVFGTDAWKQVFYSRDAAGTDLFGARPGSVTRIAGVDEILDFFIERLRTIFPHVVDRPMVLYNSNKSPMYALCFAAGNPKGGRTAVKIASYLTRVS